MFVGLFAYWFTDLLVYLLVGLFACRFIASTELLNQ